MSEYREIRGSLQGERCEHKSWADLCEKCEIDRLRSENERLKEWNREIALNAREFAAENERLRAALEDIAYPNPDHGEDQLMQIARAALEEKR